MLKKAAAFITAAIIIINTCLISVYAENEATEDKSKKEASEISVDCEAAVLMEGSTGMIVYEKNSTKELCPASITKIMTLLLIFEALDRGDIKLEDNVSVSEHAAGMGGSQVFLEPGETQTVDTMIKCISISSANDAAVAMAEYIAGTEEEFVKRMNTRAKELGMNNTNFVNCCGLDTDNHYSSALDVAIMSRELITKHPQVSSYATTWMDTIIHVTRRGSSEFGLSNTNKLVRYYDGITGLKTGSTGLAKYCLSATAKRDGMDLIAVIMAAPDTKSRFAQAQKLLDYGFANLKIYRNLYTPDEPIKIKVKGGVEDYTGIVPEKEFSYVLKKQDMSKEISCKVNMPQYITAPANVNTPVGTVEYYLNNELIGTVNLCPSQSIDKAGYADYYFKLLDIYFE